MRKKLAHSGDFLEYWRTVAGKVTDFRSAIINYEFAFTGIFLKRDINGMSTAIWMIWLRNIRI